MIKHRYFWWQIWAAFVHICSLPYHLISAWGSWSWYFTVGKRLGSRLYNRHSNLLIFGQEGRFQWSLSSANQLTTTGHSQSASDKNRQHYQSANNISVTIGKWNCQHSRWPNSITNRLVKGKGIDAKGMLVKKNYEILMGGRGWSNWIQGRLAGQRCLQQRQEWSHADDGDFVLREPLQSLKHNHRHHCLLCLMTHSTSSTHLSKLHEVHITYSCSTPDFGFVIQFGNIGSNNFASPDRKLLTF